MSLLIDEIRKNYPHFDKGIKDLSDHIKSRGDEKWFVMITPKGKDPEPMEFTLMDYCREDELFEEIVSHHEYNEETDEDIHDPVFADHITILMMNEVVKHLLP